MTSFLYTQILYSLTYTCCYTNDTGTVPTAEHLWQVVCNRSADLEGTVRCKLY